MVCYFKKEFNENVRLNGCFMENLIDIVLFLQIQKLAFCGHNENSYSLHKDNLNKPFKMDICMYSLEIQNYISKRNVF